MKGRREVCFADVAGVKDDGHDHDHDHAHEDHDHGHDHFGGRSAPVAGPIAGSEADPGDGAAIAGAARERGFTEGAAKIDIVGEGTVARLTARAGEVDARYEERLRPFGGATFITAHARGGGLRSATASCRPRSAGLEANEPSPAAIANAAELIREKKAAAIFSEPQVNAAAVTRVAGLTGAKVLKLDPLGDGDWFKMMTRTWTLSSKGSPPSRSRMPDAPSDKLAAVEYRGVTYRYPGAAATALENVSLRVEQGERLGFSAPTAPARARSSNSHWGCSRARRGKSRCWGARRNRRGMRGLVGYLPQRAECELRFPLSVRQVVGLGAGWRTPAWRGAAPAQRAAVDRCLDLVGAGDLAERPIGRLSGGQLQRVLIARALAANPKILVLDEPTVGIDAPGQRRFADMLVRVHRELGLTILIVSHNLRAIAAGCDRVACLARRLHSHVAPQGLTPEVLGQLFSHDVEGLFGEVHVHAHAAGDGSCCAVDAPSSPTPLSIQGERPRNHPKETRVRIADWLSGPLWEMLQGTLLGGLAVSLMGGILSVLVVLKRLSFIGQGVSHSAFGGIGVAALVGALSAAALSDSVSFLIILAFCIVSAIGMALSSDRDALESDTAIGVFLVASMALGAALVAVAGRISGGVTGAGGWERALFGTVLGTSRDDARLAAGISVGVLLVLAWFRRGLVFWCFDESSSSTFGVPARRMKLLLIITLAVATVTAMRLAGVVYATALLVLPGASALRLSARMSSVMIISCVVAVLGMLLGIIASIEADLPTGASIVLALTLLFMLACAVSGVRRRAGTGRAGGAAPVEG